MWHDRIRFASLSIPLIGLAVLWGTVVGGVLMAAILNAVDLNDFLFEAGTLLAGLIAGSLLAGLQRHPRRILGIIPWAALGMTIALIVHAAAAATSLAWWAIFGLMVGALDVPLLAVQQREAAAARTNIVACLLRLLQYAGIAASAGCVYLVDRAGYRQGITLAGLAALSGLMTVTFLWHYRREFMELIIEGAFLIMYRIRGHGPGKLTFPLRGPVLVVANHACWMDPMLIAKVAPRTVIPMMTAIFFDKAVLRWAMVHLVDAIRVEAGRIRRELPEINEAIERLDRGQCVIIFPEGAMRRRADNPLRMFGQGVWHILRQRPQTPVVTCWIEGNWGSYFSYKDGLPTKNKPFDVRRQIDIVLSEPRLLPTDVLAEHRSTRLHLMREVQALRQELGLEPYGVDELVPEEQAAE